eukprot:3044200-Rhodomonas_salina.1
MRVGRGRRGTREGGQRGVRVERGRGGRVEGQERDSANFTTASRERFRCRRSLARKRAVIPRVALQQSWSQGLMRL